MSRKYYVLLYVCMYIICKVSYKGNRIINNITKSTNN